VEITALGGIQFGGSVDLVGGDEGSFDADVGFGGVLGYRVQNDGLAVISYLVQPTEFSLDSGGSVDMNVGYLQIGGELEFAMTPHLLPFIGLTVGATHITPRDGGDSNWFFSTVFTGGVKVPVSKHFGLRTQMSLLTTVIDGNSKIYCTSGGGASCAISADVDAMFQGNFSVGVYLTF